MHTVSCDSVEFHTPTPYALGNSLPDELSAPGMAMSYSDVDMSEIGDVLDDQAISAADALVRAELAEARVWLKTLTSERIGINRGVTDSDCGTSHSVVTSYTVTIFARPYLWGHGSTAMEAARDAARHLSVASVA